MKLEALGQIGSTLVWLFLILVCYCLDASSFIYSVLPPTSPSLIFRLKNNAAMHILVYVSLSTCTIITIKILEAELLVQKIDGISICIDMTKLPFNDIYDLYFHPQ